MTKQKILIIILVSITTTIFAQTNTTSSSLSNTPYTENTTNNYTGFKIQLFTTPTEIEEDDVLYIKYQNLNHEKTVDNGFIYTVGDFKNEDEAAINLQNVITEFPNAKVVEFVEGKRKENTPEDLPLSFFDIWE